MRLKWVKKIEGKVVLLSGLSIGGDSAVIEIGGNDNPIMRNPVTNEPYIPGSSVKGKLRFLCEWNLGKIATGEIHSCTDSNCTVCRIFGRCAGDSRTSKVGPARIIVRDSYLTEESRKKLKELREINGIDAEIKYETSINRITSMASPRSKERVPAGIEFELCILYKVFDMDDGGKADEENFKELLKTLKLLSLDGLGGGVSRGSGQIRFELKVDGQEIDLEGIALS